MTYISRLHEAWPVALANATIYASALCGSTLFAHSATEQQGGSEVVRAFISDVKARQFEDARQYLTTNVRIEEFTDNGPTESDVSVFSEYLNRCDLVELTPRANGESGAGVLFDGLWNCRSGLQMGAYFVLKNGRIAEVQFSEPPVVRIR